MRSTAVSEHRFPQGLIKHPYHMHSFTMDMPPWTRHLGMSGQARGRLMCLIIQATGLLLQRTLCSSCGGPAGLRWHPAKTCGSRGIWWRTSFSHSDSWVQIGKHISANTHTHTPDTIYGFHTHVCIKTYKGLLQNGCNLAPGEPAHCPRPLLSLPSGSSRLAASCTAGC